MAVTYDEDDDDVDDSSEAYLATSSMLTVVYVIRLGGPTESDFVCLAVHHHIHGETKSTAE
jgi:hypothetical protein